MIYEKGCSLGIRHYVLYCIRTLSSNFVQASTTTLVEAIRRTPTRPGFSRDLCAHQLEDLLKILNRNVHRDIGGDKAILSVTG